MSGRFWNQALRTSAVLTILMLLGTTLPLAVRYQPGEDSDTKRVLRALQKRRLSREDRERAVRGYYEGLLDAGRRNAEVRGGGMASRILARLKGSRPVEKFEKHHRARHDFLRYDYAPNLDRPEFADPDLRLVTNSHGMADQEYALVRPQNGHRVALLGDSVSRGYGVPPGRGFEALVERALNDRSPGRPVEILNFSVVGYRITQLVDVCLERAVRFSPDVYMVALTELSVLKQWSDHIAAVFKSGVDLKYDYLRRLVEKGGLRRADSNAVIEAKLAPYRLETIRWALETMRDHAREVGAAFVILLVPSGDDQDVLEEYFEDTRGLVAELGVPVVDLLHAFRAVPDVNDVRVSELDRHPNERGHRMIAEAFLDRLERESRIRTLFLPGQTQASASPTSR
jgi:lysophospholipase L1-like esterase